MCGDTGRPLLVPQGATWIALYTQYAIQYSIVLDICNHLIIFNFYVPVRGDISQQTAASLGTFELQNQLKEIGFDIT